MKKGDEQIRINKIVYLQLVFYSLQTYSTYKIQYLVDSFKQQSSLSQN
jgi:hypothetical protein